MLVPWTTPIVGKKSRQRLVWAVADIVLASIRAGQATPGHANDPDIGQVQCRGDV
jgi:hypothetical protein